MLGPILLQIILIFLNAAFASAEIAVISMNERKLAKMVADGNKKAQKLASLTEEPARFLATIQVAITLAGLLGSAFAAENFAGPLVDILVSAGISIPANILKSICVFLITLILAYFSLVFGELVPKRIAMKKAEQLALSMSGMLYFVSKAFKPLVALLTFSTNLILKLIGINPEEEEEQVSEEEIRLLVLAGKEQGTIDFSENEMIQNVFEFNDISVEQICTHRIDTDILHLNDGIEKWEEMIHDTRHTYYPIYQKNSDDVVGILDTKNYFRLKDKSKKNILTQAVKQPYFIPENMKANVLFQNMKQKRCYFAVLIDEYGGMAGIITLHDLMEELVGELIEAEDSNQQPDILCVDSTTWKIQGCADLNDVSLALNIPLPTDVYDTFNGFICSLIDRVPGNGETFECNYDQMLIQVHAVCGHRILETTVQLLS